MQGRKNNKMTHLSSNLVAALASLHMNDFPHVEFELFLSVGVSINLRKYFWICCSPVFKFLLNGILWKRLLTKDSNFRMN